MENLSLELLLEKAKDRIILWRNSSISVYHECPRKFWWSVVLWLGSDRKAIPLIVGSLVHTALEFLQSDGVEGALTKAQTQYNKEFNMVPAEEAHKVWPVVEKMIREYAITYERDEFTSLYPEFPFAIELPNGEVWRGKLDKIVSLNTNLFIMEHKTSGEAPSQFFKRFKRSRQVTGYYLGASKMKLPKPITGVVVDALFKPRLKKSGEPGEVSFGRELFLRSSFNLNIFIDNTTRVVDMIKSHDINKMEQWVENEDSCFGRYGTECPYIDLCAYGPKAELLNMFTIRTPYPPDAEEE